MSYWDFETFLASALRPVYIACIRTQYSPIYEHSIHRCLLIRRAAHGRAYESCARASFARARRFKAKINNKLQSEWDLWIIRIHFGEIFPSVCISFSEQNNHYAELFATKTAAYQSGAVLLKTYRKQVCKLCSENLNEKFCHQGNQTKLWKYI